MAVGYELKRQSRPIVVNEIVVRGAYFIRNFIKQMKAKKTILELDWKQLMPMENRTIVRMLSISLGTFEIVDLGDAAVRGLTESGATPAFFPVFLLHVNFVGVGRFSVACASDIMMGLHKSRLDYAMVSAEVAKTALTTAKAVNTIEQLDEKSTERQRKLIEKVKTPTVNWGRNSKMNLRMDFDSSKYSAEDAKQIAEELFRASAEDFEDLKSKPWYKCFLDALSFNKDGRQLLVKSVKDVTTLQTIFTEAVVQNLLNVDAELDGLVKGFVDQERETSEQYRHISNQLAHVTVQEEFNELTREERSVLLSILAYLRDALDDKEIEKVQEYNRAVKAAIRAELPIEEFEKNQLNIISGKHKSIVYRCMAEQLAYIGKLDDKPKTMKDIIYDLSFAQKDIDEIDSAIKREVSGFGFETILEKYKPSASDCFVLDDGLELVEQNPDTPSSGVDSNIDTRGESSHSCSEFGDFSELAETILDAYPLEDQNNSKINIHLPQIVEGLVSYKNVNRMKSFRDKYAPLVADKTLITLVEDKCSTILFTTHGFYSLNKSKRICNFTAYRDIAKENIGKNYPNMKEKNGFAKLEISNRDGTNTYEIAMAERSKRDKLVDVLQKTIGLQSAESDKPILLTELPLNTKIAFGHILIHFCKSLELNYVEALRAFSDLEVTLVALKEIIDYYDQEPIDDLRTLVDYYAKGLVYPSEESGKYALFGALVTILQYSTGQPLIISLPAEEYIDDVLNDLELDGEKARLMIPAVQVPYRILTNNIAERDILRIMRTLPQTVRESFEPIVLLLGSSPSLLLFAPFVGPLAAEALAISYAIKKKAQNKATIEQLYQDQRDRTEESYRKLLAIAQGIDDDQCKEKIVSDIIRQAERLNLRLG